MAEKYSSAVMNTLQMCMISRKNTVAAARSSTVMWGIPLDFNMFAVCGCCAVLSMLVGVWVFRKTQDRFVLHI